MAKFYVSVSDYEMAMQVANMLNRYNKWMRNFSAQTLLTTDALYFVELCGSTITGCASCVREYPELSKIQHICVLPEYRKRGIARRLAETAIVNCDTEYVYMTIRDDNTASLMLAKSMGFAYVKRHWFKDHWTLTFGRRRYNARVQYTDKGRY